jgi:hypothetical protein
MEAKDQPGLYLGAKDAKDLASDSDSLEYSNDDRSEGVRGEAAEALTKRPPVHPIGISTEGDKYSTNDISTPKRRGDVPGIKSGPGPLQLFSPGLSPIRLLHGDAKNETAEDRKHDEFDSDYKPDMNSSIDSLEMGYQDSLPEGTQPEVGELGTPNYRYWKNRLFGGDQADSSFEDGGVRSSAQSVGSDMNVAKKSLVFPASHAQDRESEPRPADLSIDSDLYIDRESLVYPTTAALYQRSGGPQAADRSGGAQDTNHDQDIALSDKDSSLLKQSFLARRETPAASPAAAATVSARTGGAVTTGEGKHQDVKHGSPVGSQTHRSALDVTHMSMLDRSDLGGSDEPGAHLHNLSLLESSPHASYFRDAALEQSVHSVSLLPGSPGAYYGTDRPQRTAAHRYGTAKPASTTHQPTQAQRTKRTVMVRPSAAAVRLKQLVTSSDTEYVASTVKRRAAEQASRAAPHAWDTSDLRSPSPATLHLQHSFARSPQRSPSGSGRAQTRNTTSASTGLRTEEPTDEQQEHSPVPTLRSSVESVAGSHRTGSLPQSPSAPAPGGLQVGGLYTLVLDDRGHPTFVPVVSAAQLQEASMHAVHAPVQDRNSSAERAAHNIHLSPPPAVVTRPVVASRDPYRHNFAPVTSTTPLNPDDGYNSNHIDLESVLDRALHRGSLSAEKLDKRWREREKTASTDSFAPSQAAVGGNSMSPPYKRFGAGAAAPAADTPRVVASSTLKSLPPKSPFRVVLGEDGREQWLPSAEYWKERLQARALTSVLPQQSVPGQHAGSGKARVAVNPVFPVERLWEATPLPATGERSHHYGQPAGVRQVLQF